MKCKFPSHPGPLIHPQLITVDYLLYNPFRTFKKNAWVYAHAKKS